MSGSTLSGSLAVLLLVGAAGVAQAQAGAPSGTDTPAAVGSNAGGESTYLYATQPEGKSLPERMMRIRLPYETQTANKYYGDDGKKSDNGFKLNAAGGAVVIEYGLTNKASLQIMSTYVQKDHITADAGKLANTPAFQEAKAGAYASQFAALGQATGTGTITQANLGTAVTAALAGQLAQTPGSGCTGNVQACAQAITSGTAKAPAGGLNVQSLGLSIPEGTPLNAGISAYTAGVDAKINDAITQQASQTYGANGSIGLGDTQIGVLYELYHSKPVTFAVAGGVRVPTGKNPQLGTGQYPTTRGVTEIGARINLDMLPIDWFMISWQNESDYAVAGTKVKDAAGDELKYTRKGVRNVGFVYLKPSLVPLHSSLNILAPRLGVTYDHDSGIVIDGKDQLRMALDSYYAGLGFDLTRLNLPFQFDVEYTSAFAGKNYFAVNAMTYTLKAYYTF